MASTSDGGSVKTKKKVSRRPMKQPSLLKQLKCILKDYPDGGQILKELIQNAEDAGAREVRFMYDRRQINEDTGCYTKFFKGPALCVYNDAVFTEKDWEGIQMIYSSVKEDDSLKIGQFGLGFKSVFHITDYPCVLSGDRLLLIDPQQDADNPNNVNSTFELASLQDYEEEGFNPEAFWKAFDRTFDLKRDSLQENGFEGTLFWFPLRKEVSALSDNLYNEGKVMNLFELLHAEASNILVFLSKIEKISILIRDEGLTVFNTLSVEINDNNYTLRKTRDAFWEGIANLEKGYTGEDIYDVMTIKISTFSQGTEEFNSWLIVKYFVCESMSDTFRQLCTDPKLHCRPYVGVAAPLGVSEEFEGNVFCFLPLPKEGERLTGLPVHINGYFVLSQNRHHMVWETDEEHGKKIEDKEKLWNKALLTEALPRAYKILLMKAIETSVQKGNTKESTSGVYNMFPLEANKNVHSRWQLLTKELYRQLRGERILYCKNIDQWIQVEEACFATVRSGSRPGNMDREKEKRVIVQCLNNIGKKYTDIPFQLFDTLKIHFSSVQDLTPEEFAGYLRHGGRYQHLKYEEKMTIFSYLINSTSDVTIVGGLDLLPLASGGWTTFSRNKEDVFLCSEEAVSMFPGLEHKLVMKSCNLAEHIDKWIKNTCKSGKFQIKRLDVSFAKGLIQQTMIKHIGSCTRVELTNTSALNLQWLEVVWNTLNTRQYTQYFDDIPLVPVLNKGTWHNPESVTLFCMKDMLLLKEFGGKRISEEACSCFATMSVTIVPGLPQWLPLEIVREYIHVPDRAGIQTLIGKISKRNRERAIAEFNQTCDDKRAEAFIGLLVDLNIDQKAVDLLQRLKIFKSVKTVFGAHVLSAVHQTPRYLIEVEVNDFPASVQFADECLKISEQSEQLVKRLGGTKTTLETIVEQVLRKLKDAAQSEKEEFMFYFLNKFGFFEHNDTICRLATDLAFLRVGSSMRKPSDLFDPSESFLQNLLCGENLFPENINNFNITILRRLGLKSEAKIDCGTILSVAKTLDQWSNSSFVRKEVVVRKALAFKDILQRRPVLLQQKCLQSGQMLYVLIQDLSCIVVQKERPTDFPPNLHWFSDTAAFLCPPSRVKTCEYQYIIGSRMSVVDCSSNELAHVFGWNINPYIQTVIEQIEDCQHHFETKQTNYYAFCAYIQKIYHHLSTRPDDVKRNVHHFKDKKIVWTGVGFEKPSKVIVNATNKELNLQPYFYKLPQEFSDMKQLFLSLGCPQREDTSLLMTVLTEMSQKIESVGDVSMMDSSETKIAIGLLKELSASRQKGDFHLTDGEVLMLTNNRAGCVRLKPVSQCILAEDEDDLDDDEMQHMFTVHRLVPEDVAVNLGVRSLEKKTIHDASEDVEFQEWGQSEPLTKRISSLITEGYRDGLSVPKELIQNADDARASVVKFLYDERLNLNSRTKLLSSGLNECQGPALWVFNDAVFTEDDMENISKLNGGTKAESEDKIGKFGLGFCAVYNLTDVPSFLSRKDYVIFDPHETYIEEARKKKGTGLRIHLSKRNLIRRNVDQFKPYASVFDCTVTEPDFSGFNGTLFRLPLRTDVQAQKSLISNEAYTKSEVMNLLKQIAENAGNILLFTQSVKSIQVYHLPPCENDPKHAKLLFEARKNVTCISDSSGLTERNPWKTENVLMKISPTWKCRKQFRELHQVTVTNEVADGSVLKEPDRTVRKTSTTWIISWALGLNESSKKKLVPLTAAAVPVSEGKPVDISQAGSGFYAEGHIFCFLPLPVKTGLKVHINGCFHVTSDRRSIFSSTEDDKGEDVGDTWNRVLMQDSLVCSFIQLLKYLSDQNHSEYVYYTLWPLKAQKDVKDFRQSFLRALYTEKPKIFKGNREWLSIEEIIFLDPSVRRSPIGDLAFELLSHLTVRQGKHMVEMPHSVLDFLMSCEFRKTGQLSSSMITEEEVCIKCLDSIEDTIWKGRDEERNRFVLYALKTKSEQVIAKLKLTRCIPSEPKGTLCRPDELVDPRAEIAEMFDLKEGVFPLSSSGFYEETVVAKLVELGMHKKSVSHAILLERCRTVEMLLQVCNLCAVDRSSSVLQYIDKWDHLQALEKEKEAVRHLQNAKFVPVMQCPKTWKLSWGADSLCSSVEYRFCQRHVPEKTDKTVKFERPSILYRGTYSSCLGSVCSFIDESLIKKRCFLSEKLYIVLGVKSLITEDLLVKQLRLLPEQYKHETEQFFCVENVHRSVLQNLGRLVGDKPTEETAKMSCLQDLKKTCVILIGKSLVSPENAAFNVKSECPPNLCKLQDTDFNRKKVYMAMGVSEHFSCDYMIHLFKQMKVDCSYGVCVDIDYMTGLITNLCDCMTKENKSYADLVAYHENIVAPDTSGHLWPTHELVIEDPAYEAYTPLHILHENVSPAMGKIIGVKSKQKKIVEGFSSQFFMPFGQNESLVTRLSGILEDYPCDSSIMKELIQNADDAGATEIHIIKCYETYSSTKLFGKPELQGPSLCIFNDSYFTEEDFNGIRNLGIGSKREDPSKTGQYGIGFNAVYHISDVPSFYTKGPNLGNRGQLCIFDPLMEYLEDGFLTKENPGIKCDAEQMARSFPEMLLGYPNMETLDQGTVFRLPLRQKQSQISKNVMTIDKMEQLIEDFKHDMLKCMLFLKRLKCIKVFQMRRGQLEEEYSVSVKLSSEDNIAREIYFDKVKKIAQGNRDNRHLNLELQPIEVSYEMTVEDSRRLRETWRITNIFGAEKVSDKYLPVVDAFRQKNLGLLPWAAVAVKLHPIEFKEASHREDQNGQAFCFLPLPIKTGLPLHVNGHFALDKSRSKLIEEGIRKEWNEFIISEILSRCWISTIQFLKIHLFDCSNERLLHPMADHRFNRLLDVYHDHFPVMQNASDMYWKCLVAVVYKILTESESDVFPSVIRSVDTSNDGTRRCVSKVEWVPLSNSDKDFKGYFNGIYNTLSKTKTTYYSSDSTSTIAKRVEKTLKKLGMKIIETPKQIRKSAEESGVVVPLCNPKSVFKFLKTFTDQSETACNIGAINSLLINTNISDERSVFDLLLFLMAEKTFPEEIEGIPLCLTADLKLRVVTRTFPVYWSPMSEILTGSAELFLHPSLLDLLNVQELFDIKILKVFEMQNFIEELPKTFSQDIFGKEAVLQWKKEAGSPCEPTSIRRIFQYIYRQSLNEKGAFEYVSFDSNIRKLKNWSLIPSSERYGNQICYQLMPVSQLSRLFYRGYGNELVNQVLDKFNLPTLDILTFANDTDRTLVNAMHKLLPSTAEPTMLLECLVYYKDRIASVTLKPEDGLTILMYFCGNLKQMKQNESAGKLRSKLQKLPLYLSQQHKLIQIYQKRDVIVFPRGMPSGGIAEWAEETDIVLLTENDTLKNLYTFLNITQSSEVEVYTNQILPNIQQLPKEYWLVHLQYIKDNLLVTSYGQKLDSNKKMLVEKLKILAFIQVNGVNKRVDELFDPENKVFQYMLDESLFIPAEFRKEEWEKFLELLGLIKKPSDDMMIQFALDIERTVHSPVCDRVKQQSKALAECLFYGEWDSYTLQAIKDIRFVVPFETDSTKQDIFPQLGEGKTLISFSGAIHKDFGDYCWSTVNLLTDVPAAKMMKQLSICDKPPIEKVVQHCQNICHVFKKKLDEKTIDLYFVKGMMEKLYKMLNDNFSLDMVKKFQVTPLVLLPEDEEMVDIRKIVLSATKEEEIKPFLCKLPICFGPFEKLFSSLGVLNSVRSTHYAMVLENVRDRYLDQILPPNMLLVLKRAIENLIRLVEKEDTPLENVKKLFLPDKQKKLVESTTLTVSNNADIEERLHGHCDLSFFLGFRELDIVTVQDPAIPFLSVPYQLKPQILTDVIIEEIATSDMQIEEDVEAQIIEAFLRSPELIEGILRLVKHQMKLDGQRFESVTENKIMNSLRNVILTKVTGLKTYLTYKGNRLEGTARDAVCFITTEEQNGEEVEIYPTLFFQYNSTGDLLEVLIGEQQGLTKVIDICTKDVLGKDMSRNLITILHFLKHPSKIKRKLDELRIDAYSLPHVFPVSVFPEPGTYVEEMFFPFLEHDIVRFKLHEFRYVALEIEENLRYAPNDNDGHAGNCDSDDQQLIYVYAHILKEVPQQKDVSDVLTFYQIDVGQRSPEPLVVPIHRLYKFRSKGQTEINALEVYDIEPVGSIPIDENFKRVRQILIEAWSAKKDEAGWRRVIRRLRTRWHPDRNREHKDYAFRIFNYIGEIVLRLERGELIVEETNEETGLVAPDMLGSSYPGLSRSTWRRGLEYARAFYDNLEEYNNATRSGPYAHHRAEKAVVRHIGEAKRWLKQAQQDFIAAKSNMDTSHIDQSFNWVCYKCHQAAEKALKAAWFANNANRAKIKEHSLTLIASGLDNGSFIDKCQKLESVIGSYFSMRYPDAYSDAHTIPSENFTQQQAEESLEVTKELLEMAVDAIG